MKRQKKFKHILILIFAWAGVFATNFAHGVETPPIPEKWRKNAELDRMHNIPGKYTSSMPRAELAVVPIYHVEVNFKDPEIDYQPSEFLNDDDKDFIINKETKKIRVFFLESSPLMKSFKARQIPIFQKFFGTKFRSHSTYLVWDPATDGSIGGFLKFSGISEENNIFNGPRAGHRSIRINDTIEKMQKGTDIAYYPERFFAYVGNWGYIYRSLRPVNLAVIPDTEVLPLHGFLGSSKRQEFAEKMGLDTNDWILKEYLPKLAKWTAELQFRYGIHIEAHTQNISVQVNQKTGEIIRFIFRDMNDVMFDFYIRALQRLPIIGESFGTEGVSLLYRGFVGFFEGKLPWFHMAAYLTQSIRGGAFDSQTEKAYVTAFTKLYLAEIQNVTSAKIELDSRAKRALRLLESPESVLEFRATHLRLVTIIQSIYENVTTQLEPRLSPESMRYDQSYLRDIFLKLNKIEMVAYSSDRSEEIIAKEGVREDSSKGLTYSFDGKGIYAIDPKTDRIVGYAHDLLPTTIARIEQTRIVPKGSICAKNISAIVNGLIP